MRPTPAAARIEIEHESSLLVANERVFREQFAVECRTNREVVDISAGD